MYLCHFCIYTMLTRLSVVQSQGGWGARVCIDGVCCPTIHRHEHLILLPSENGIHISSVVRSHEHK